jgi:hypothetical protein
MKKEKFIKEIRIVIPPSLYDKFKKKCDEEYKTISEACRELMVFFVNSNKGGKK